MARYFFNPIYVHDANPHGYHEADFPEPGDVEIFERCPDLSCPWDGAHWGPPAAMTNAAQKSNVEETAKRTRADAIEEIERKIALGASQEEINLDLLNLLKEQ